jgi:1-acyl-sn-glycerol-3-phosphate acyltransferase
MLFYFLRFFVQLALKFYFRTIYFLNEHSIPKNQPVILAGNHSNSALDAIIIDAFLKKNKLYWLARGDVFSNKWIAKFMTSLRTAPIYRSSEVGFVDIKRNSESFEICFDLLSKNRMVGIFPEGITVPKRKLHLPFKKGFARLAFQAHEKLARPIMILPVGVSYHSLTKTRTDAFVKFGSAFSTDLFYKEYLENQANGLKSITHHLENELNKIIINYDSVKNQTLLNSKIEGENNEILLNKSKKFGISTEPTIYQNELKIVNEFIELEKLSDHNQALFSQQNITSKASAPVNRFMKILFLTLVYVGKIIHFSPNKLSKFIIKTKIKNPAFWGTVRFIVLYAAFPIYIILLAIMASFFSKLLVVVVLFLFPFVVYLGLLSKNILENRHINFR